MASVPKKKNQALRRYWLIFLTIVILTLTVMVLLSIYGNQSSPATSGICGSSTSCSESALITDSIQEWFRSMDSCTSCCDASSGSIPSSENSESLHSSVSGSMDSASIDSGSLVCGSFESASCADCASLQCASLESACLQSTSLTGASLDSACEGDSCDSNSGQDSLKIGDSITDSMSSLIGEVTECSGNVAECLQASTLKVVDGIADVAITITTQVARIPGMIVQAIAPIPLQLANALFGLITSIFDKII